MNKIELEQKDTINLTEKKSVTANFNPITKRWERSCPLCSKILSYTTKQTCFKKLESNSKCKSCSRIGNLHWSFGKSRPLRVKNRISKTKRIAVELGKWINPMSLKKCREKLSKSKSGNKHHFYGKHLSKTHIENISKSNSGNKNGMFGVNRKGNKNPHFGKKHSDEAIHKIRIARVNRFKILGIFGNFNPHACEYFDVLSTKNGWNLQHAKNGGEIVINGFFLDSYDRDKNIVVEYDEPHHFVSGKLREKDILRMQNIVNTLHCSFYRYNEKMRELIQHH